MFGVRSGGAGVVAFLHRPGTGSLVAVVVAAVACWALHRRAERATRAPRSEPGSVSRPEPLPDGQTETPAIVALLTNGYDVPRTAVTATALDLAARGWVRLASVDGDVVVVTRGHAAAGDSLRPYEQQVLNHLASRAFNDVVSAATLAGSHHRLDRRWWLRFGRSVADHAQQLGLTLRRYTALELAPTGVVVAIGLIIAWTSARGGEEVALEDSWKARAVWLAAVVALLLVGWRTILRAIGSAQRPTELGAERTAGWMGYRRRLRERIPGHASVLAPPPQQVALAHASVMGVATHVLDELPAAPEDHRAAWSEAGGAPHVVHVRYPVRPGYGQHPLKVGGAGLAALLIAWWLQRQLEQIADGRSLTSLLEKIPGQVDLVHDVARVLSILCWIPIVFAIWAVIAGAVDSIATRERIGSVVRSRQPVEVLPRLLVSVVKPLGERDRFSTYLAVDDGRHATLTAWLANERSAAPQGAQARVRATPLLGYVRSSEPIGTATRGG